jgi:hypothetical protein
MLKAKLGLWDGPKNANETTTEYMLSMFGTQTLNGVTKIAALLYKN